MTIERAIQVFGQGFAYTKSFTRPYVFVPLGPLWLLRDAEKKKENRKQEVIVYGISPEEAHRIIQESDAERPFVCAIRQPSEPDRPLIDGWKGLGYRFMGREAFMSMPLDAVPSFEGPLPVQRVATQAQADHVNRAAGHRQLLPEHIGGNDLLMFAAWDGERPVGWVRSGRCGEDAWVSNMYVRPDQRRRGIGKSLLSAMLQEDKRLGIQNSVLLASVAGSKLYPCLGYELIGELLLFCPNRRSLST